MQCKRCVEYYGKQGNKSEREGTGKLRGQNSFINGCYNLRHSTVKDHDETNSHQTAVDALSRNTLPASTVAQSRAGKALRALKASDRIRLGYLVRNAHAIAKQNRPLSDYTWLSTLDKAKGVELGQTYLNPKAGLNFIRAISETQLTEIHQVLDTAPFFSFMMDGSSDISGKFCSAHQILFLCIFSEKCISLHYIY